MTTITATRRTASRFRPAARGAPPRTTGRRISTTLLTCAGFLTITARRFGAARRRWPPRSGPQLRIALVPPAIVTGFVTDRATGRLLPSVARPSKTLEPGYAVE